MKKSLFIICLLPFFIACSDKKTSIEPVNFVNTLVGVIKGNTFPTAGVPFGMVTPGPHLFVHGRKTADTIVGFGQIHISGSGCGEKWGGVVLMPFIGENLVDQDSLKSKITYNNTDAGYFNANIERSKINIELSATKRTTIHKYRFPSKSQSILIDLSKHLNNKFGDSYINIKSNRIVEGFASEGGFCTGQQQLHNIYFVINFNQPFILSKLYKDTISQQSITEVTDLDPSAVLVFNNEKDSTIIARIGISYVSVENARENLESEQPNNPSFESIKEQSQDYWNEMLSRIQVTGKDTNDLTMFYTGMYHLLLHPNIFSDVNGEYPSMGRDSICKAKGYTHYTVFSLWDSYRNVHSLLTLVYPEYQTDMINSMLEKYKQSGWLPKWEHVGTETYNMNGCPATPVIVDTYIKGLRTFNIDIAYEAIRKDALFPDTTRKERIRPGLEKYIEYGGWIPQDFVMIKPPVWGPISTTLEYNFADWCIAQMAQDLGKKEDAELFINRSTGYKNFYNSDIKLMAPKCKDDSWFKPFNPLRFTMFCETCPFVEGTSWNYSFSVPHDVNGLIQLMGSDIFTSQLQKCFDSSYYAMFNEPDIIYPYLFNFIKGSEWRTQKTVRETMRRYYNAGIDGLPGEEDCGTMSAWLVYSMMGFYPVCPGSKDYQLTSPLFDKVEIKLNEKYWKGSKFVIESKKESSGDNIFIKSIVLNGKAKQGYTLSHDDIVSGGQLVFELSNASSNLK